MNKLFGTLLSQFNQFFASLPPLKKRVIIFSALAALIGLVVVSMTLSKSDYVPLLTNVAQDQMPLILSNLQSKNITFKVASDGKTIMVPRELLPSTQMAIMSELGGSKIGSIGLEIFEKQIVKQKTGRSVPVITTLHGTDITLVGKDKTYEPVVTFSINESDSITAVSENLKAETYKHFDIKKEIEVIHNFVDVHRYNKKPVSAFRQVIAPHNERMLQILNKTFSSAPPEQPVFLPFPD